MDELVNKAVHAANRAATAARVAAVKAVQNRIDGKFCDTNVWPKACMENVNLLIYALGRCHPDEQKLIRGWERVCEPSFITP